MIRKAERKLTYPVALLLSSPSRKTFESLGREAGVSGDSISRIIKHDSVTPDELIKVVNAVFKRKRLYLIIDDTLILKTYSKFIAGTSDNFDSADRKTHRSLCSVVAMITDGTIAIPVDQAIWTAMEFATVDCKKKWELAEQLIAKIYQKISIYMVLADGLYAIVDMLKSLIAQDIRFEMRLHANRVIKDSNFKGQVKNHPKLRLSGKRPMRTIKAEWYGMSIYITAFRRVTKYGRVIITYQVSNYKASARKHVRAYEFRWNIEKFFRTAKQKLGLNDCQSRKKKSQENHLLNVFFAYAFLQYERKKNKLKNVESVIKSIKGASFKNIKSQFTRSAEIFGIA